MNEPEILREAFPQTLRFPFGKTLRIEDQAIVSHFRAIVHKPDRNADGRS